MKAVSSLPTVQCKHLQFCVKLCVIAGSSPSFHKSTKYKCICWQMERKQMLCHGYTNGWNAQGGSYTSVQMVVPKCQVICNEEKRLPNIGLKIKRVCLQKRIWWFSSVHLFIDDHFFPLCLDIPPKQTAWSSPWEPIQRLSFIYKFHYTKEQNVLADWIDITWQPTDFSIWEKYLAPTEKS